MKGYLILAVCVCLVAIEIAQFHGSGGDQPARQASSNVSQPSAAAPSGLSQVQPKQEADATDNFQEGPMQSQETVDRDIAAPSPRRLRME